MKITINRIIAVMLLFGAIAGKESEYTVYYDPKKPQNIMLSRGEPGILGGIA
jgi:hypothetical protein